MAAIECNFVAGVLSRVKDEIVCHVQRMAAPMRGTCCGFYADGAKQQPESDSGGSASGADGDDGEEAAEAANEAQESDDGTAAAAGNGEKVRRGS